MSRRKGSPPPFEVMRDASASGRAIAPQPVRPPDGYDGPATAQGGEAEGGSFMDRLRHPVVLRLPRGYVILGIVGFLGLVFLAYEVGAKIGFNEGEAQTKAALEKKLENSQRQWPLGEARTIPPLGKGGDDRNTIKRGSGNGNGGGVGANSRNGGENGGQGAAGGGGTDDRADPPPPPASGWPPEEIREAGLNYPVLARFPEDEARRLVAFLAERGVATVVEKVDNGRFYLVIAAAEEGFSRDTVHSPAAKNYENQLRSLGRAWKRHNNNRGTDLSDMYWKKYTPGS